MSLTNYTCPSCATIVAIDVDALTYTADADGMSARVECTACDREITVSKGVTGFMGTGGGGSDV